MKLTMPLLLTSLSLALTASPYASAQDINPKIRKVENCSDIGWVTEKLSKFAKLKANKRDTVGVSPSAQLQLDKSLESYLTHFPERFFIRDQNVEIDLDIASDGHLVGFEKLRDASKSAQLCHFDSQRAGLPFDADGISLDINTDIQFHNNSGTHSLEEIRDGLKDGKSHYKKSAGALAFMVPKMSHIMIKYEDEAQPLQFTPLKNKIELTTSIRVVYCVRPMIKVEDLESIGADHIKISGGPYRILPVPSLAAMKRFEGCDEKAE